MDTAVPSKSQISSEGMNMKLGDKENGGEGVAKRVVQTSIMTVCLNQVFWQLDN